MLDILDEFLHIAMHFFYPLPHVKYDLDTRQIHAEIASEIQNQFQPFDIFLSI